MTQSQKKAAILISLLVIVVFLALFLRKNDKNSEETVDMPIREFSTLAFDLESNSDLSGLAALDTTKGHSGTHSIYYNDTLEFGVTFERPVNSFNDYKKIRKIDYSFYIKSENTISKATSVITIEMPDGKPIHWEGLDFENQAGDWSKKEFEFNVDQAKMHPNGRLKIYIWNKGREKFSIDDLSIKIFGI